jgi:hypothetical protein
MADALEGLTRGVHFHTGAAESKTIVFLCLHDSAVAVLAPEPPRVLLPIYTYMHMFVCMSK